LRNTVLTTPDRDPDTKEIPKSCLYDLSGNIDLAWLLNNSMKLQYIAEKGASLRRETPRPLPKENIPSVLKLN
jgi:hypothetical protein